MKTEFEELIQAILDGKTIQQWLNSNKWQDVVGDKTTQIIFAVDMLDHREIRIKPPSKLIQYRNWLSKAGDICAWRSDIHVPQWEFIDHKFVGTSFSRWLGDEQTLEIDV